MKIKIFTLIYLFLFIIYQLVPISNCDDFDDNEFINTNAEIITDTLNKMPSVTIPNTNSRACVVIDRNTNIVLYGKNENTQRKMASTTKIMTATIVIENSNLNDIVTISKKAANTGGSRLGLKTGDKITVLDLLYGLMLRSGNDAAVALAEYVGKDIQGFAEMMNKKANELGLKNTHFETPHGLDSSEHYTTAYELATLSNYALKNEIFSRIVGTKNYTITINNSSKNISNTNELLGNLNGVYGIKTGFTNGANRCLVTACKRNDIDIICVVLGADTKNFRTQDSVKLINYIFDNFEQVNIQDFINKEFDTWKNEYQNNLVINKGIYEKLNFKLEMPSFEHIPIRKDLISNISTSIDYKNYFEAPLDKEDIIGNVKIVLPNDYIFNYNIYIENNIPRKSWNNYLVELLKNYFYIIEHSTNLI